MPDWLTNSPFPMPEEGSSFAASTDWINALVSYAALFFAFTLTGLMLFFMIRYRRHSEEEPAAPVAHNWKLEVLWTSVPLLVCVLIFYYGFSNYSKQRNPPADALEINVEAFRWGFNFEYSTGKKTSNELVVPVNKPVRLILRSRDVIHSFFIPSMRVKEDMIKGDYHYLWFTPVINGEFPIFCAEYCGAGHSLMRATLKVVDDGDYQRYINEGLPVQGAPLSPVERGRQLYAEKACIGCHSLDGSRLVGPSFKGLFGTQVDLEGGGKVQADENYIRRSIEDPGAEMVAGYPPNVMPVFKGQVTDEELVALTEFIKSLK